MNILLLFINVIFWLIFYIFYLDSDWWKILNYNFDWNIVFNSLSWNLLIESVIFFVIWILSFFLYSNIFIKSDNKEHSKLTRNISLTYILNIIQLFFRKYLYYIWLIFSYSAFYFILKYFWYNNFSYFILTLNFIVLFLFLTKKNFLLFRDFIKINTILFSLYYIIFFILIYFNIWFFFIKIDIINSILIFIFFLLTFYNDRFLSKNKKSDIAIVSNFFIYCLLFLSYYLFIENIDLWISILLSSTFLFTFIYYFITKIKFFKNSKNILNAISIIISYVSWIASIYLLINNNFIIFSILNLIYIGLFNFIIHYKYQNYISYLYSIIIFLFLIFYFYFKQLFLLDSWFIFLWLGFAISGEIIIYSYFYDFKYEFDYYFLYTISYLITFFVIVYYFYTFSFDLLTLGIILLVCSIIAFWSYFKLRQLNLKLK